MQLKLPEKKDYPEAYHAIINALRSAGQEEIGEMTWRYTQERFKNKDGETRAASLDLTQEGRAARTCAIVNLSPDQLSELHRREVRRGFFIANIRESLKLEWEDTPINDARMEAVTEFNNDHRPECRQFRGVYIPPYFPLDNYFDGMEYHHAWDKAILANKNGLSLPEIGTRKTGKAFLEMAMALLMLGLR